MPLSATPDRAPTLPSADGDLDLASRIARADTIARPQPRISRRTVAIILGVFAVVGIAAGLLENYLNAHLVTPPTSNAPNPVATSTLPPLASSPTRSPHGPTAALLGLTAVHGAAPGFRLVDQAGKPVALSTLRGKVVVVSFFDASCNDICPVLAAELRAADRDLGAKAASVALLTVNADPLRTGAAAAAEGAARSGLGGPKGLANWRFLSGPLPALNTVWKRYGMTIQVVTATRRISHNNVLWFVSPTGRLAYEATPFANEQRHTGAFHLPAGTEARFGAGIARYARALLTTRPARP